MRKTLYAIIGLFFVTFAHAEYQLINGVIEMTDQNWDQTIAEHENLLITFYAPWW